jgi:cupin 2 domain-containing protein
MKIPVENILANLPTKLPDERFDELLRGDGFRLERIVSTGQATPAEQWYDQDHAEWVLVLRGSAQLQFEGEAEAVALGPGDYVLIPAHCRHRVQWTDDCESTVWLALHCGGSNPAVAGDRDATAFRS